MKTKDCFGVYLFIFNIVYTSVLEENKSLLPQYIQKFIGFLFTMSNSMIEKTQNIRWSDISFLSTNSAYNLRTSLILSQFN